MAPKLDRYLVQISVLKTVRAHDFLSTSTHLTRRQKRRRRFLGVHLINVMLVVACIPFHGPKTKLKVLLSLGGKEIKGSNPFPEADRTQSKKPSDTPSTILPCPPAQTLQPQRREPAPGCKMPTITAKRNAFSFSFTPLYFSAHGHATASLHAVREQKRWLFLRCGAEGATLRAARGPQGRHGRTGQGRGPRGPGSASATLPHRPTPGRCPRT